MTDRIVYLVTDSGVDGRSPASVIFASFDEQKRDAWHAADKNKAWHSTTKQILEIETTHKKALRKLDGIERLVLDIPQREVKK